MDVLYSLLDVHIQQLNPIIQDKTFTNTLNFILTTSTDDIVSITTPILDRFCINILPTIDHNIKSLILESKSMERILLAADYPSLTKLKLFNFKDNIVSYYFTDESSFRRIFREQITDLILIYDKNNDITVQREYRNGIHEYIMKFFHNLKYLSINGPSSHLILDDSSPTTCFSSILTKLCVYVYCFQDCLTLLDGRLKQLTTFIVEIDHSEPSSIAHNMNNLPNLTTFSIEYRCNTTEFDIQVLPLLRRMSNLEELTLIIYNENRTRLVDGTYIHNQILLHLQRLYKFNFYIRTCTDLNNVTYSLSSDNIQQTFTNIGYRHVKCILYNITRMVICHAFSLPFISNHLEYLGNTFPSIVFTRVTKLLVFDILPFEHEFFIRLARFFPFLKDLSVMNLHPQLCKSDSVNYDHNQQYPVIEYPYLDSLHLEDSYIDYVEQFINETKIRLPRLKILEVDYRKLNTITKQFTRDVTRLNCAKVHRLIMEKQVVFPKTFYVYFPLLESASSYSYYFKK
ncbi:unnamed protein product [Adineta steineri]|nr:unnamed protein product [Adineta steineri]